jgi:hypothetical protein
VPESKDTLSAADKSGAGSSDKKQQMAADAKPGPSAKSSSKVCGITSATSSAAESLRVPVDSDATGKTEVN